MSKLRAAFNDQLRELDAALLGETQRKAQWYDYEGQMLDAYIAAWKGKYESNLPDMGGTKGSRANGGYVSAGLWNLHNGERVQSANEVNVLESLVGGKLTQQKIAAALMGGAGGGTRSASLTLNVQLTGLYDSTTEKRVRRVVQEEGEKLLAEVMS